MRREAVRLGSGAVEAAGSVPGAVGAVGPGSGSGTAGGGAGVEVGYGGRRWGWGRVRRGRWTGAGLEGGLGAGGCWPVSGYIRQVDLGGEIVRRL